MTHPSFFTPAELVLVGVGTVSLSLLLALAVVDGGLALLRRLLASVGRIHVVVRRWPTRRTWFERSL